MKLIAIVSSVISLVGPMPPVMHRIAMCETQNNSQHSTRDYISRYGIYRPSWNEYRPDWVQAVNRIRVRGERLPSIWEQDAVALQIAQRAGLTAWECFRKYEWVKG